MDKNVKLLLIQNKAILGDREANFRRINELLEPFGDKKFDLIVLPELWNVGWACDKFSEMAEDGENSETINFLKDIAKRFSSNVVGGSFVRKTNKGELKNSCPVLDREGNVIDIYDKMHLYSYAGASEGKYITQGNRLVLADTDIGKLGITICYDIRFPEVYRKYAYEGADILINVAAWGRHKENQWTTLQKARAIENQIFMLAVCQTGIIEKDMYNLGHSMVINPLGDITSMLKYEEKAFEAEIDLNEVISLREAIPTLNDIHKKYEFSEV